MGTYTSDVTKESRPIAQVELLAIGAFRQRPVRVESIHVDLRAVNRRYFYIEKRPILFSNKYAPWIRVFRPPRARPSGESLPKERIFKIT